MLRISMVSKPSSFKGWPAKLEALDPADSELSEPAEFHGTLERRHNGRMMGNTGYIHGNTATYIYSL